YTNYIRTSIYGLLRQKLATAIELRGTVVHVECVDLLTLRHGEDAGLAAPRGAGNHDHDWGLGSHPRARSDRQSTPASCLPEAPGTPDGRARQGHRGRADVRLQRRGALAPRRHILLA